MATPYEWRIDEIERKAHEAASKLYKLDTLICDVDRLERSVRELSSERDGLRDRLVFAEETIHRLEREVESINSQLINGTQ